MRSIRHGEENMGDRMSGGDERKSPDVGMSAGRGGTPDVGKLRGAPDVGGATIVFYLGLEHLKPLAFLISLPFALIASVLSIIGAIVFIIGLVLSCICPCCICCAILSSLSVVLVKLPVDVILWFLDFIPC
ncbi:hypothetical protein R6Q59_012889 [Mikania micrantha]